MGRFTLELDNENVGAWMAINNAFTFDWPDQDAKNGELKDTARYTNGVLVQFGRFRSANKDNLMTGFEAMVFGKARQVDDKVEVDEIGLLEPDNFRDRSNVIWVNAYANATGNPVPLDRFRKNLKLGEYRPSGFVRAQRLHRYLQPYLGGITLWNKKGYEVRAEPNGDYMKQTFTFDNGDVHLSILRLCRPDQNEAAWHWEHVTGFRNDKTPTWTKLPGDNHLAQEENFGGAHNLSQIDTISVRRPIGAGDIGKNPPQQPG